MLFSTNRSRSPRAKGWWRISWEISSWSAQTVSSNAEFRSSAPMQALSPPAISRRRRCCWRRNTTPISVSPTRLLEMKRMSPHHDLFLPHLFSCLFLVLGFLGSVLKLHLWGLFHLVFQHGIVSYVICMNIWEKNKTKITCKQEDIPSMIRIKEIMGCSKFYKKGLQKKFKYKIF